jgi:hypothetical protein
MKTAQMNILVPAEWREQMLKIAREYSIEQNETFTYMDLIRMTIKEKYNLVDNKENVENE